MLLETNLAETCLPEIPFRKRFTLKEAERYVLKRCKPLLEVGPRFSGHQLRVNPFSGEGVRLDYIGCAIYDEIVRLNKILTEPVRVERLKEYDKLAGKFSKLRGVFGSCYGSAYRILVN